MLPWLTWPRFFYLSKPKDPESAFQVSTFNTVLFGTTSSPFMFIALLHHHLENFDTPFAKSMKSILLTIFRLGRGSTINHDWCTIQPSLLQGPQIALHPESKLHRMIPLIQKISWIFLVWNGILSQIPLPYPQENPHANNNWPPSALY